MYYTITGGTDKTLLLLDNEGIDGEDAWDFTKRLAGKSSSANDKSKDKDTNAAPGAEGAQEEDPIKWGRQRGQELEREREGDMDYLPEDFFDGMTARQPPRGDGDDEDDEFLETVFLVVLCAVISGLVYLRGRWVAQRAEEQREREGQQQDGQEQMANAMFPLGENFGIDR
ncbi:hypothetical protein FRC07_012014 [Ceratobasidium sp. 392]|nr:hypothetical protein FRC07_012014 [Ceratobasidium sp. 392]